MIDRIRQIHRDARDARAVISEFWDRADRPDDGPAFDRMLAADDLAERCLDRLVEEMLRPLPESLPSASVAAIRLATLAVRGLVRIHESHDWPDAVSLATDVWTVVDSLLAVLEADVG